MDHQITNSNGRQFPASSQLNGESVVTQLEELLDNFENLDESTLKALERVFGRYKTLRPGFLTEVTSYVSGGMSNFSGKFAALGKKNSADEKKRADIVRGKSKQQYVSAKSVGIQNGQTPFDADNANDEIKQKLVAYEQAMSQECLKAERAYADAKARYEYQKGVLSVYEETVAPFVEPFKKVMENLVYFAACADPVVYEEGKTPLRNKSRALRNGMQPGMWGEYLNAAHLGRISEMFDMENPVVPFSFRAESAVDVNIRITAYKYRVEAANGQRKPYDTENAKLANQIKHTQLLWEYVNLLRSFLPQLEKIINTPEDAECTEWATEIGTALLAAVENHACRNPKMKFQWVYPHGELSRKNEKIRVQFISAELDCPGLYYILQEEPNSPRRFICVAPGYSKE
ncbi:MAG: hypothetical protein IKA47_06795 [Oscillospiraceae bacterium]|nr:hypothetical protein [Oscillospiraceae bacterium]